MRSCDFGGKCQKRHCIILSVMLQECCAQAQSHHLVKGRWLHGGDLCIYKHVARKLALVGAHAWLCTPHIQVGVAPVGAVQAGLMPIVSVEACVFGRRAYA